MSHQTKHQDSYDDADRLYRVYSDKAETNQERLLAEVGSQVVVTLNKILRAQEEMQTSMGTDFFEQSLSGITTIAGLLVVATFPLVPQDLSTHPPGHFSATNVHSFAAISVGLFLLDILFCQTVKAAYQAHGNQSRTDYLPIGDEKADTVLNDRRGSVAVLEFLQKSETFLEARKEERKKTEEKGLIIRLIWLYVLLELMMAAILFLLLIMAAYVWRTGMVLVGFDVLFMLGILVTPGLLFHDLAAKKT